MSLPRSLAGGLPLLLAAMAAQAQAPSQSSSLPAVPSSASSAPQALGQVVVTATRSAKAVARIPGAVSVVTRQEMDEQLRVSEDPSALLAMLVPGYAPSRQKMSSMGESLRGRAALILFDGIPQTNPLRMGAREGYFADPAVIERIEVISGASAVQGLGATGGIINYISRTPRQPGTRHTVDLKASSPLRGSDSLGWKTGYRLEHLDGAVDALFYAGLLRHGVGVDGQGRRLGLDVTQGDSQDTRGHDLFAKLGWRFAPQQRLQVSFNQFRLAGEGNWTPVPGQRSTGLPTSARRGAPVGEPPRNRVRTAALEWRHAQWLGGDVTAQAYRQLFSALYGASVFANFQDPALAPVGTLQDQSEIVARKTGLKLGWVRPDLGLDGLELSTGLDVLQDTSEQRLALTDRAWVPPLEFRSIAPFAKLEYEWGPLTLRGGLRREAARLHVAPYQTLYGYKRTAVAGGERGFTQWVKNLGGVWQLGAGWSAFAAYSEGVGLPDVGLVLRAVNTPGRSVHNLVDLQPVLTGNRELGLTWHAAHASLSASVYDSRSELGSQVRVDSSTGVGHVERLAIRVRGLELSGEFRPLPAWTVQAGASLIRGRTARLPGGPLDIALSARTQAPDKQTLALRWAFAPGASARLQAARQASRHVNAGVVVGSSRLEERFQGYTLADLSLAWTTGAGARAMQWGLGVENLTDRQYLGYYTQSIAGTDDNYFAGRGRTFSLSWQYGF